MRLRPLTALAAAAGFLVAAALAQESAPPPRKPGEPAPAEAQAKPHPEPEPEEPEEYDAKLIYRPTPMPDRVILTWAGDPATTQAVTWRTDTSVRAGVAQLARAEGGPGFDPLWGWKHFKPEKLTTANARTQYLKTAVNEAHFHTARFTGLAPKTKYVYRVGDGVNWSEWFQFETASDRPEPFGFIYFGDAQNGLKTLWSRVARGAYSDMPKAKFILHAGDLVNGGRSDTEWGEWHAAAGWINGMVPSVPTPGNHEYAGGKVTPHWRPQFALPENGPPGLEETCYYFDIQGVRVISLNSNEKVAEQVPWLRGVLAKANNPNRWTVVAFHHPVYSTAKGRDNKTIREAWRPVFDEFGVDLVLQGHDHAYGRSGLMREDNLLTGANARDGSGTVYVVSVSGAKMYSLEEQEWMASSARNTQLYQLIRIDGNELRYEARTAAGEVYDTFVLRKGPDGRNELTETLAVKGRTDRVYWNAAGGVLILALVLLAVRWAAKRR